MIRTRDLGVPISFHEEDPDYIENNGIKKGYTLCAIGQFRSYNKIVDGKITEHSGVANTFEAFWENGLIKSV